MARDQARTREATLRRRHERWLSLRSSGTVENWKNQNTGGWERTFAIITVPSNELVAQIHNRMPAILQPTSYGRWLSTEPDPHDVLITYPSEPMTMWPISTRVNKPENDDATLLERTCDPFNVWAPLTPEGRARAG